MAPKETKRYEARLVQVDPLSESVRNFHFDFPGQTRFDYRAGQFVMVEVSREDKKVRKPYSIASPPHWPDKIQLCIKRIEGGYVSNYFFNLSEGARLAMQAPWGHFFVEEADTSHFIFVATGTGVAPFRAQIHDLLHRGITCRITLIFGVRYENEILFDAEWRELQSRYAHFEYIPTVSRPRQWSGAVGYVQDHLQKLYPYLPGRQVYICGLVPMVDSLKKALEGLAYPKDSIHFEKWT